ncbi:hypothetical protein BDR07DRAFT_1460684 [Suillus spraguei]|nr:hypothetical protein BDR07DRAFT_1460684 [Suillus spraguei]
MRGIVGRGVIHAASTRTTISSSENQSTLCPSGIATQRLPSSTCRMFRLRQSRARLQTALGTREDGPFRSSSLLKLFSSTKQIGLYISTDAHKESVNILGELERSTGINARALVDFRPGTTGILEKLRWASKRDTTREEDIAYLQFGIFGIHIPVIYGEKRQNALGRLLQYIIAHSGDITALDWVGQSSNFNSCLPTNISSYKALPYTLPSLCERDMQISVFTLRNNTVAVESALKLYTTLKNLSIPRFADTALHHISSTEVRQRPAQDGARRFTYDVKAYGLQDLLVTTKDQFSPARRTEKTFLLVRPPHVADLSKYLGIHPAVFKNNETKAVEYAGAARTVVSDVFSLFGKKGASSAVPWNRYDLGLINFANKTHSIVDSSEPESPSDYTLTDRLGRNEPATRELRLIVRLGQPFRALLLAQQWGEEYKRIASDNSIIAQVRDTASVYNMREIRMLDIL